MGNPAGRPVLQGHTEHNMVRGTGVSPREDMAWKAMLRGNMSEALPSFAEFKRLADQGTVVPVYRTIVADLLSPVSAFLRLAPKAFKGAGTRGKGGSNYSFLLESVEGGERVGRYTYFGVDPFQVITCRGDRIMLVRGGERVEES